MRASAGWPEREGFGFRCAVIMNRNSSDADVMIYHYLSRESASACAGDIALEIGTRLTNAQKLNRWLVDRDKNRFALNCAFELRDCALTSEVANPIPSTPYASYSSTPSLLLPLVNRYAIKSLNFLEGG